MQGKIIAKFYDKFVNAFFEVFENLEDAEKVSNSDYELRYYVTVNVTNKQAEGYLKRIRGHNAEQRWLAYLYKLNIDNEVCVKKYTKRNV